MSNRIEQVIGDIEEYIDGCKMQAFSNTRIIVDRTQIEEYLDELRQYTPEEVKKYQRMLNNRDKILGDAKKKAQDIEEQAKAYAEHLVSENQITRMAYDKANEILQDAKDQAKEILENASAEASAVRQGALAYTNDMLDNLRLLLSGAREDCQNRFSETLSTLNEHLNIVEQNQHELNGVNEPEEPAAPAAPFFETDEEEEDQEEDE
ncbi:MAG: hypothetical protein IJM76_07010 [Lachnospiraceae bacterium]|nr:hypothetical protein [Lachnospiraceae bacterium]